MFRPLFVLAALLVLPAPLAAQPHDIAGTIADSLKLLTIEHGVRVALQPKTRAELDGPFWGDYARSVRMPRTWEDTDSWLVNYVGHPVHGAAAGFVWLDHDPSSRTTQIGLSPHYWATRGRAAAFAAVYSLQFEIGPFSEASIGNVGMKPQTTGWVDYVVTPGGAFAILAAEDALDRFLVQWVECRVQNAVARASLRMLFSPSRVMANVAAGHQPWYRGDRTLQWRK